MIARNDNRVISPRNPISTLAIFIQLPLFIDFHNDMQGVSRKTVCGVYLADVDIQDDHGVKYHKFWINEEKGLSSA